MSPQGCPEVDEDGFTVRPDSARSILGEAGGKTWEFWGENLGILGGKPGDSWGKIWGFWGGKPGNSGEENQGILVENLEF